MCQDKYLGTVNTRKLTADINHSSNNLIKQRHTTSLELMFRVSYMILGLGVAESIEWVWVKWRVHGMGALNIFLFLRVILVPN